MPRMRQYFQDDQMYSQRLYFGSPRRRYGFFAFVFDLVMTGATGGLWLLWVFCREMRRR
jgi:hypothetical protein